MAAASADVGTLKAMFEHWDEATLAEVLAASGNDMNRASESILSAGSPEAWRAARARAPPSPPAAAGAAPQGAVSVVVPPGSRGGATLSMTAHGRSFMVTVPQGLRAGDRFVATIPPPRGATVTPSDGAPRRGKLVTLPADFLQSFSAYKSTSAAGRLNLDFNAGRRPLQGRATPRSTSRRRSSCNTRTAAAPPGRRRAAAAAGARQRSFPSFSRSSGSQPASSGGYSACSTRPRRRRRAGRAAGAAGRGASALKNKVARRGRLRPRRDRRAALRRPDSSDELDDHEPAPEWKGVGFHAIDATLSQWPRRLDGVEAHKGPQQYFSLVYFHTGRRTRSTRTATRTGRRRRLRGPAPGRTSERSAYKGCGGLV